MHAKKLRDTDNSMPYDINFRKDFHDWASKLNCSSELRSLRGKVNHSEEGVRYSPELFLDVGAPADSIAAFAENKNST